MMILTNTAFALSVLAGAPSGSVAGTDAAMVAAQAEAISGTVKSADMSAKTFTVALESGEDRQVSWNDATVFLLDGEKSDAKAVLVTDGKIRASLGEEDGVATSVSRWSE
jgi:hypothetical protein